MLPQEVFTPQWKVSSQMNMILPIVPYGSLSLQPLRRVSSTPSCGVQILTVTASEDDKLSQVKEDAKIIAKTGEIVVYVHRRGDSQLVSTRDIKTAFTGLGKEVHEKAIKGQAKSHGTSYVILVYLKLL